MYKGMASVLDPLDKSTQIVVTGHSLGAGIAGILAIYLKVAKGFVNVKGFCFAPPGGMLNFPAMEYSKNFIVGLSFGKDMIPRLGRPQLENLMNELVENLTECQENKWRVILFGTKKVKKNPTLIDTNNASENSQTSETRIPASHPTNLTSETSNDADSSSSLKSSLRTRTHRRNVSNLRTRERIFLPTANNTEIDKTEDMFPAGQQHHISQDYELGQVDQSFYDDILIGARMMYDHFPNSLLYAVMAQQSLEQVKKLNRISKIKNQVVRSVKPFIVKAGNRVEGSLLIRDESFIRLNNSYDNKMISFKFNVFDATATPLKIDKIAGKNHKSPKKLFKSFEHGCFQNGRGRNGRF
jgi:hypothetical protein